jgi:hypothetical protein
MTQECNNLDSDNGYNGRSHDGNKSRRYPILSKPNSTRGEPPVKWVKWPWYGIVYCDDTVTFSEIAKERNLTQHQISREDPRRKAYDIESRVFTSQGFAKDKAPKGEVQEDSNRERRATNNQDTRYMDGNHLRRILRIKITGGRMRMSLLLWTS